VTSQEMTYEGGGTVTENDVTGNDITGNGITENGITGNGVTGNEVTGNDVGGNNYKGNCVTWSGVHGVKSGVRGVSCGIYCRCHHVFSLSLHLSSHILSPLSPLALYVFTYRLLYIPFLCTLLPLHSLSAYHLYIIYELLRFIFY